MRSKKTNLLILFLVFTGFLFLYYPKILISPNSYLFNGEADGFKNYYTYIYHVKHDSSMFQFGGMHYPYGENVVFTDGHPLTAWIVKTIAKVFPSITDYSVGIINWMMIISLLFSAIFIYLILNEYGVGPKYSAACAFAIAALSPQLMRYLAHYALSYSFAIPLNWYMLLQYQKSSFKFSWAIFIGLLNTCLLFTHMYLGMICIIFLFCYWTFFHLLRIRSGKSLRWKHFAYLFIQIIIPLIISQLYLVFTDYHNDRPIYPLGFFNYHAGWETIFLPYYCWFAPHIHDVLAVKLQSGEGIAYIGIFTILFLASAVITVITFAILKLFKKENNNKLNIWLAPQFRPLLLTAIVTVLFSMAYPFRWNMEFILDWIPQLRQFRSLGRFAWIFYYVSTVYCAYVLNAFFINTPKRNYLLIVLAFLFPALQFIEAIPYHRTISESIQQSENLFNINTAGGKEYHEQFSEIDPKKYQAIIALPFYHEGSENFMRIHAEKSFRLSQLLSYYTGIPMVNAGLGRTSIEEAKRVIQIVAPNYYFKPVKDLMKNTKPFLIIYSKENLTLNENKLLKKAMLLKETKEHAIYEISFEKLFADEKQEIINEYNSVKDSLHFKNGVWIKDTMAFVYYNDFEGLPSSIAYKSSGAYTNIKNGFSFVANIEPGILDSGKTYVASFWYYNKGENKAHIFVGADVIDMRTNKGIWDPYTDGRFAEITDGDWSLIELPFTVKGDEYKYGIFLNGQINYTDTIYVDNALVRPADVNVYWKNNGGTLLVYNNHRISIK